MQPITAIVDRTEANAAWVRAAEDVAAAILANRVHNAFRGLRQHVDEVEVTNVTCAVHRWIPSAKEAWESSHPDHSGRCRCRHEALAIVGASWESRQLGLDYQTLMGQTLRTVNAYLDTRS